MTHSKTYKIILADDHEIFRLGLRAVLETDPQLEIVAEASNGVELLELLKSVECDLVILDLSMPEMDGFTILELMASGYASTKRLVLSMHADKKSLESAIVRGIDGYLNKEDAADTIKNAVHRIRNGKKHFSADIQEFILSKYDQIFNRQTDVNILTRREKEIANMIAAGQINKQIAALLNISIHTVQFHRSNIMKKLQLKNTADLVKHVLENSI